MFTIHRKLARRGAPAVCMALAPLGAAIAADEHFVEDGVATGGCDSVAFHSDAKPTPGSPPFTAQYQGVTWQFASAAHRDLFAADPAKYAPAYGGWCSAGASKGKKVPTKPEYRAVVDGHSCT